MSSLRNAAKNRRTHRERHQPASRQHLGLLEKKKDYRLRAKDRNEKASALKLLRQRALNRNPDEFYINMIDARVEDGVHREIEKEDETTEAQLKLMQTQDMKYIIHKRTVEMNKIDKLRSELHLLDAEAKPQNKHTFFVDTKKQAKKFDVAKHLNTHPAMLDITYNRPQLSDLQKMVLPDMTPEMTETLTSERRKSYKILRKRIEREKELLVVQQKMEIKRYLQNKNEPKVKRVKRGSKIAAPVYKWKQQRKK